MSADTGENDGQFPRTHWSKLAAARDANDADRNAALDFLLRRYWKPVFCYLRGRGWPEEEAKDLVQDFFASALARALFGQADPARGRFRSFLLSSLNNFLANAHRAAHAQKRRPEHGFVSIHELATSEGAVFVPVANETPEALFHRAWIQNLLQRVLRALAEECRRTGKDAHYEVFRQRIMAPALEGATPPPLADLARRLDLGEKEAANCLLTARRAYQRLLRAEIRLYAATDDEVAAEIQDLFHFLAAS